MEIKKIIALLRVLGIVALVVFVVLCLLRPVNTDTFSFYRFTVAEKVSSFIAVLSFVVIMGMQLYRFYIGYYYQQKDNDADA